jgi:hypothetical protein
MTPSLPSAPFPVSIDLANQGRNLNNGNTPGTPLGPFAFGGALYDVLYLYTPGFATEIVKSTDGGKTWTPLDAAHQPGQAFGAGYLDTANSKVTFFTQIAGVFQIYDFSLIAGTWGAVYHGTGVAPANVSAIYGVYLRPDGSRIILFQNSATNLLNYAVLSAGNVWAGTFSAATNVPGGTLQTLDAFAVMDSTGRLHVFFACAPIPLEPEVLCEPGSQLLVDLDILT